MLCRCTLNVLYTVLCRCILNVLYTVVETLRTPKEEESEKDAQVREAFRQEMGEWSRCCYC